MLFVLIFVRIHMLKALYCIHTDFLHCGDGKHDHLVEIRFLPGYGSSLLSRGFSLLRPKLPLSVLLGMVFFILAYAASADELTGPFKVKLEISHLPRLNEEVALICSVTSPYQDVDSAKVGFGWSDTAMVKVIKGQKKHYCKFKKDETKVFELTVTFPAEGIFCVVASANAFYGTSGTAGNRAGLNIKTYKDTTAVLLERMPWKLPDRAFRWLPPAVRDSIAAAACSLRIKRR